MFILKKKENLVILTRNCFVFTSTWISFPFRNHFIVGLGMPLTKQGNVYVRLIEILWRFVETYSNVGGKKISTKNCFSLLPIELIAEQVNVPPSCSLWTWSSRISVWLCLILNSKCVFIAFCWIEYRITWCNDFDRLDFRFFSIRFAQVDRQMFDKLTELYDYIQLEVILRYLRWRFAVELDRNWN